MTFRADTATVGSGPLRFGQAVLVLFSLLWAIVPGFGLIDLDTAIPPGDPDFRQHWFYEGTWGLLVTALVVAPLLTGAVSPELAPDVARQQVVLVGCLTVAALFCLDPRFLVLPVGLGLSTWAWWVLVRPLDRSSRSHGPLWWPLLLIAVGYLAIPLVVFGPDAFTAKTVGILVGLGGLILWLAYASRSSVGGVRRLSDRSWVLLTVVASAAGPWLAYAIQAAGNARDHDYSGSGIDRLVAQAAFPLCLLALLTAAAVGWISIRIAAWPAAVAGAGFGFFAVWYPQHVGSPGRGWGAAALAWSACLAIVAELVTRSAASEPPPG